MTMIWSSFVAFVLVILFLDLFVLNRKQHVVSAKEALRWTAVFICLGAMFGGVVYYLYQHDVGGIGTRFVERLEAREARHAGAARDDSHANSEPSAAADGTSSTPKSGHVDRPGGVHISAAAEARANPGKTAMTQYITGWLTEYSLSIDNIFVIALVFSHFRVAPQFQHRVLFWGIIGALVLRGVMIAAGAALVTQFEWILIVFGALLIYTAFKMVMTKEDADFDEEHSFLVKAAKRVFPISQNFDEQKFFTKIDGKRVATPLFLVLLVVEGTDVIFAVDSIPAILGITTDPFLVFSSNVFAIMGLRSLYFALASLRDKFAHLKFSLGAILFYVGGKMIYEYLTGLHVSSAISLSVIAASLVVGVGTSLLASKRQGPK